MTLSLANAIPVAGQLPRPQLSQCNRVRCPLRGSVITAPGLVARWVTLTPYNSLLWFGLHAVEGMVAHRTSRSLSVGSRKLRAKVG